MGSLRPDAVLSPRNWTVMTGQDANDAWWWILLEGNSLIDGGSGFLDFSSGELAADAALRVWERPAPKTIP